MKREEGLTDIEEAWPLEFCESFFRTFKLCKSFQIKPIGNWTLGPNVQIPG